ncbi:MAG: cation:proton antiporter [Herbinix sp.]|nr:cation:proton antiporter [Herbinix sp.]
METYKFLMDLALILLSTKLFGLITKKFNMPQVVGALLAGLLLGPAIFNILNETEFIISLSEVGVIVLMFTAGLESDISELKKTGKASFIIALCGVIFPLIGGFVVAYIFNRPGIQGSDTSSSIMLQNIFIGVILTATSVSITVETLKEMGKLSTNVGNAILGAAIIDDILGIIALTIITSTADDSVNITVVLLKILAFFICTAVIGFLFFKIFKKITDRYKRDMRRFVILAFVFCLLMAYCSEVFFGVADITGAYMAGLILSNSKYAKYILNRFEVVSYVLLSPIFFASIGLKVVIPKMTLSIILFSVLLVVIAVLTKVIGCGLSAKACSFNNKESLQIGVGMVSRGEVALIVASKGASIGLMSSALFGPIIIVVVVTTIISPILLKMAFKTTGA